MLIEDVLLGSFTMQLLILVSTAVILTMVTGILEDAWKVPMYVILYEQNYVLCFVKHL